MFSSATKRIRKAGCIVIILLLMCSLCRPAASRTGTQMILVFASLNSKCIYFARKSIEHNENTKSKNILSSDFYAYNIPTYTTRRRVRYRRVWRPCSHTHIIYYLYYIYYIYIYYTYILIPHIDQRTEIILYDRLMIVVYIILLCM